MSAPEGAILVLAALFLAFGVGWTLRGQYSTPIRVETTRRAEPSAQEVTIPTPSDPGTEDKVDINRATVEELATVPGIGEALAMDIVAERERGGPFRFPEDLTRVPGIGEEKIREFLDYITVGEGS